MKHGKHLFQANHNVFIAHCKATKALRELVPDAKMCGMNAIAPVYPETSDPDNLLFAQMARHYMNGFHTETPTPKGVGFLLGYCDMSKRYGFVFVNRTNKDLRDMKRVPKKSYAWIKKAFESNGEILE
ncbi:family 1 glycosylhydrolase [Tannockella kyphosi]|uniref:family 1 glycosylhydrolase n=1 Tax=Tannockella kyphosi TaxID=2899121 RepID=UPI0020110CEA|nr:family 1 glycosylhydrolase [Tannockella kyphosi]